MCLGVPMQVLSVAESGIAQCVLDGQDVSPRIVDTTLLDVPPGPGDWVLVHVRLAIRTLDAQEAQQISDALRAVSLAANGDDFEHLLGDLADREPQLPAHLRAPSQHNRSKHNQSS